jgi:hypothetical protein
MPVYDLQLGANILLGTFEAAFSGTRGHLHRPTSVRDDNSACDQSCTRSLTRRFDLVSGHGGTERISAHDWQRLLSVSSQRMLLYIHSQTVQTELNGAPKL